MHEKLSMHNWRRYGAFIASDLIGFQASFVLAYIIRIGWCNPYGDENYQKFSLCLAVLTLLVSLGTNTYKEIFQRGKLMELRSVAGFSTIVVICMIALMFISKGSATFSRLITIMMWLSAIFIITLLRIAVKAASRRKIMISGSRQQVLLAVTPESMCESSERAMNNSEKDIINIKGLVVLGNSSKCVQNEEYGVSLKGENDSSEAKKTGIPVVAYGDEALDYMNSHVVDSIIVDEQAGRFFTERMMNMCLEMGITVHQELHSVREMGNQIVEKIGDTVVLTTSMKIATSRQVALKRLMDITGGIIGSVFTLLILIAVTPVIKIQSPGPVIFRQKRVGRGGRIFTIYKIRTMYTDAEERKKDLMDQNKMQGIMFKVDDDPRIYPFGSFLRKTSMDEFPQFFNVLRGEMSLVGTRPPTLDEYEQYEYRHQKRLSIKPGITGLWQISGRSEITDFEEIVALDAQYITEWQLILDIKIILKTIGVVLKGGGAQ